MNYWETLEKKRHEQLRTIMELSCPASLSLVQTVLRQRQANVSKGIPDEKRSQIPGERFFLDISSIKTRGFGGSKFLLLLVDDENGFKFSYF